MISFFFFLPSLFVLDSRHLSYIYFHSSDILHIDKQNVDAIYVRGMCLYYQDNVDRAFAHFQQVFRLAPDHTKALDIYKVIRDFCIFYCEIMPIKLRYS